MVYGFTGGVVFNLSNFLVVGAIAVAGLGVAFPVGVGLALVVGVVGTTLSIPRGIRCCCSPAWPWWWRRS